LEEKLPAGLILEEGETILWHGRMSWKANWLVIIIGILTMLILIGIGLIPILVGILTIPTLIRTDLIPILLGILTIPTLIGFIVLLLVYLRILSTEYLITTNRVYVKYGLISRKVRDVRIEWITSATVAQGLMGRILNFGDLLFVTPGEYLGSVEMIGVHDPLRVKAIAEDAVRKKKKPQP
jgi:uncharacterized membrane protein YdbT with pleckstrin-like domain